MESHIRKLKDDNTASALATYVVIMFGMIFIMYLFGYTSMWGAYSETMITSETGETYAITNPIVDWGINIISMIASSLHALLIVGASSIALIAVFIFAKNVAATALTFIIPAMLLLMLNIFVFPISGIRDALEFADAPFGTTIITGGLVIFFNLFYILAVIEWIRGPS